MLGEPCSPGYDVYRAIVQYYHYKWLVTFRFYGSRIYNIGTINRPINAITDFVKNLDFIYIDCIIGTVNVI